MNEGSSRTPPVSWPRRKIDGYFDAANSPAASDSNVHGAIRSGRCSNARLGALLKINTHTLGYIINFMHVLVNKTLQWLAIYSKIM